MEVFTNPWVIAIGTGVIVGLILYFVFGIGKLKPKHGQTPTAIQEKNHSKPPAVPVESATHDITPEDIIRYLNSLPPLQQSSAAEHYKGIRVSWTLNLNSGHILSNGKLHLMMLRAGKYPWVSCDVDPKQYPMLRVINKTQLYTVEGEIEAVQSGEIILKNCRFLF